MALSERRRRLLWFVALYAAGLAFMGLVSLAHRLVGALAG